MNRGDFLLGVGTVFGSIILTVLVEFFRSQFERWQRCNDRRDENEREAIYAVQDAMYELLGAAGERILNHDSKNPTPNKDFTHDLLRQYQTANAILLRYVERIREEDVRKAVMDFHVAVGRTLKTTTSKDADEALDRGVTAYSAANTALGRESRKL